MLSTPEVNNGLLPYGSIITGIRFYRKNREWIKTQTSKNQDTLIAPEDDRVLNDIYRPDQLPDFRLGARLHLHVEDRYHNFQQNRF